MPHHEFVTAEKTVNATFYLEIMKRRLRRIRRVQLEYEDPGSWMLLHANALAYSGNLLKFYFAKNHIIVVNLGPPPTHRMWLPADFFSFL